MSDQISIGNNYLRLLPREIQRLLLLYLSYEDIVDLCKFKELSYICEDVEFWYLKIKEFGINRGEYLHTQLKASDRYLYFKLITDIADIEKESDYLTALDNTVRVKILFNVLVVAIKNDYESIINYIMKKYQNSYPLRILSSLVASGSNDQILPFLKAMQINFSDYIEDILKILKLAARKGNIVFISNLFDKYRNERISDDLYFQPLKIAISYNHLSVVKYLISKIDWNTERIEELIESAITSSNSDIAIYLIETYKNKFDLDYNHFVDVTINWHDFNTFMYLLDNYDIDLNSALLHV